MKLLRFLTFTLAAVLIAGCAVQPSKVTDPTSALTAPILRAELALKANDTSKALSSLHDAETAASDEGKRSVETQTKLAKDETFIEAHNDDLLGARTHRIAKWIVWIGIPLFTLIGGVLVYSGNATAIGAVAHGAIVILSGGLHAVTLAAVWVWRKIRGT